MRTAISPRFAIRTFGFLATRRICAGIRSTERERSRAVGAATSNGRWPPPASEPPCAGRRLPVRRTRRRMRWPMDGAPEWTLVAAGHQTAGRGPPRPHLGGRRGTGPALLDRAPAVAAARGRGAADPAGGRRLGGDARREVAGRATPPASGRTTCSWASAKVGGVLAESRVVEGRLDVVILGSGINLEPPPLEGPAAGLGADVGSGGPARRGSSCGSGRATRSTAPRLSDEVRARWRAVAATLGRDVRGREDRRGPDPRARPWTSTRVAASCSTRATGSRSWPSARSSI